MSDFYIERSQFASVSFADAGRYLWELAQNPDAKPNIPDIDPRNIYTTDLRTYRGRAGSRLLLMQMMRVPGLELVPSFPTHGLLVERVKPDGKRIQDWHVATLPDGTPIIGTGIRLPQEDAEVMRLYWLPREGSLHSVLSDPLPAEWVHEHGYTVGDEWAELPPSWPIAPELTRAPVLNSLVELEPATF